MAKYLGKSYSDVVKGLLKSGYILEKKFDEICWLDCGKLLVFICAYVNLYHRDYDVLVDCYWYEIRFEMVVHQYETMGFQYVVELYWRKWHADWRKICFFSNGKTGRDQFKDFPIISYGKML